MEGEKKARKKSWNKRREDSKRELEGMEGKMKV
jgi:hypothetical protein